MKKEAAVQPLRLSALKAGARAAIHAHEAGDLELTLLEMGCLPGEPVSIEMVAPMGDPLAIRIAGYCLSLRRQDADNIWVTLL